MLGPGGGVTTDIERRGVPSSLEPARVRAMFDRIAGPYDVMNRVMTAGLDRRWRALAADEARVGLGASVIDVCCGTGELSLALAERVGPAGEVIGVDFAPAMLGVAQRKTARRGIGQVQLITADALELPFPADRFAAATIAFGARNLSDLDKGFSELRRVVRPGGRVVCLEITTPKAGMLAGFYRVWFDRLVPVIGRVADHGHDAYSYLPASVRRFPDPDELGRVMQRAGLRRVRYRILAGGIIALHTGEAA
jgi:demethylmenaquinone methyltransferase / 2-methoxy-6-polyprenyl-1,4-benzoquinol methylase